MFRQFHKEEYWDDEDFMKLLAENERVSCLAHDSYQTG